MGNSFHNVIRVGLGLLMAMALPDRANAEDYRTFTNKEGRQIVAETLEVNLADASARLRLRDGREFAIPIGSLSLDDQAWLVVWEREKRLAVDPGGWKPVEVRLPLVFSQVEAPGCYGAFYRIGLKTWRGELPEGAWLRISEVVEGETGSFVSAPELALEFDGSWSSLEVSFEDGFFFASFDGGTPRLVGVTSRVVIDETDQASDMPSGRTDVEATRELQEALLGRAKALLPEDGRLCFQPAVSVGLTEMRRHRDLFDTLILAGSGQRNLLDEIEYGHIRGLRTRDELDLGRVNLDHLQSLEFLGVGRSLDRPDRLSELRSLRIVDLNRVDGQEGLDSLARVPNLSLVRITGLKDDEATFSLDGWDGLPNLVGIDFDPRHCQITADSVSLCRGLRAMRFEDRGLSPGGEWLRPLASLRNVSLPSPFDVDSLNELTAGNAWGSQVRMVKNANTMQIAGLSSLRAIVQPGAIRQQTLTRVDDQGQEKTLTDSFPLLWPHEGIREAAQLEYVAVDGVSQEWLDALCSKRNPESIRTLILSNLLDCADLSGLGKLRNLRVLSLSNFRRGFLKTELAEIDVRSLDSLEILEVVPNRSGSVPIILRGDVPYLHLPGPDAEPQFLVQ